MDRFVQLNLRSDGEKIDTANLPKSEEKEPSPPVMSKRLHRLLNKAAHKAASEYGRSKSGIFSK